MCIFKNFFIVFIFAYIATWGCSKANDSNEENSKQEPAGNDTSGTCTETSTLPSIENLEFRSVDFFMGWGPCYDYDKCRRRLGVSYDGTLVLADDDGTEVFQITNEELAFVKALADSPETHEYIQTGSCPGTSESGSSDIELTLKNGKRFIRRAASGCTDRREPIDPIGELYRYIFEDLGKKYLECSEYEYTQDDSDRFVISEDSRANCAWRY